MVEIRPLQIRDSKAAPCQIKGKEGAGRDGKRAGEGDILLMSEVLVQPPEIAATRNPVVKNGWTGQITRALTGQLTHPALWSDNRPDVIMLTASKAEDGTLALQGESPCKHWRGSISADRTQWSIGCQWGFTILGAVTWDGAAYQLRQTRFVVPPELRIGEESGVVVVELADTQAVPA